MIPTPEDTPTMTVGAVAALIGVSRATAYEAVRTGEIPSIRIGNRIVIPTAELRRMLGIEAKEPVPATPADHRPDRPVRPA